MIVALIVLLALLVLLGGGGFAYGVLWYILLAGLVLWVLGFLFRAGAGGGRWYYW